MNRWIMCCFRGFSSAGYIRYGVRFASTIDSPVSGVREEVPSRGDAMNNIRQPQHRDDEECCCGVVQLPWRSSSSSRIPLPFEAMNRRGGIFSRINSGELARGPASGSTLQHEDGGVRRMQPRRRIVVRPKPDIPAYLKLCSSASSDSESCHLITVTGTGDDLAEEEDGSNIRRNTLDRLHKFRFGGGGGEHGGEGGGGSRGKKKTASRSSDKAERLRELTERLKGGGSSSRHQIAPAARERCSDAPADRSVDPFDSGSSESGVVIKETSTAGGGDTVGQCSATMKDDDIFDCVTIRLNKPESRPIVGSYAQRTIPFRSASFSQVDFSSADGKYIRSSTKSSPFSCFPSPTAGTTALPLSTTSVIAGGSLTLPRKKVPDIPAVCSEEPGGSTPSVDSAVGSDEGYVTAGLSKIPIVNKSTEISDMAHKTPGSRSLTYPLPRRGSRPDDDIPFSSIDGNGLKSLQYGAAGRELQEVQEENETSLADSQQSSCSQVDTGGGQPVTEGEVFHDWRKAEECHLTCEPPVCLGELLVCSAELDDTLHKCEQKSAIELSSDPVLVHQYEHSVPESLHEQHKDAQYASQTKEMYFIESNEEDKIVHLTSDANLSKIVKAEELSALEESPSSCQESNVLQESVGIGYEKTLPNEDTQHPSVLQEKGQEIYITHWPNNDDQGADGAKETIQGVKPLSDDVQCGNDDWPDTPSDDCNAKLSADDTGKNVGKAEKFSCSDGSQLDESCTDVEDSPPTHTVSIVSPQWQRSEEWDSAQEESQSPDEGGCSKVQWTRSERWLEKPKLVYQSSEEREEEGTAVPRHYQTPLRADSLSEGESDQGERCPVTRDYTASPSPFAPSDLSDSEGRTGGGPGSEPRSPHTPRRYSKRPLRGPYGQMLEAEMSKAETNRISKLQLGFLEKYVSSPPNSNRSSPAATEPSASSSNSRPRALTTQSLDDSQLKGGYGRSSPAPVTSRTSPKRKVSANIPYSAPHGEAQSSQQQSQQQQFVCHQRTTSSPSQLEGYSGSSPRPELLAELLQGSSERMYNGSSVQHGKVSRPECLQCMLFPAPVFVHTFSLPKFVPLPTVRDGKRLLKSVEYMPKY